MSATTTAPTLDATRSKRPRKVHIFTPLTNPYFLCGVKRPDPSAPGYPTPPAGTVPCANCRSIYVRGTGRAI